MVGFVIQKNDKTVSKCMGLIILKVIKTACLCSKMTFKLFLYW